MLFRSKSLVLYSPLNQLKNMKQDVDIIFRDLDYSLEKKLINRRTKLLNIKNRLDLLNPMIGLDKGCGVIIDNKGKFIKSIDDAQVGEEINIILRDGSIKSIVKSMDKGGLSGE